MGRNKIKIEKIQNERIRQVIFINNLQVTFYKRKRGIIKKAMELALLCEVKIFMCIVDKNDKTSIYSSENNISNFLSYYILNNQITKEVFWSKDVYMSLK